ncbi:MAG: hypothetical protein JXB07_14580 [Anaerolineae bacterium]|nr:hypothetical protein [Anaerolineae bacterium]
MFTVKALRFSGVLQILAMAMWIDLKPEVPGERLSRNDHISICLIEAQLN